MRVLVCGGREYTGWSLVSDLLEKLSLDIWCDNPDEEFVVIQGGAKGADFLAKVWAVDIHANTELVSTEEYPANWKKFGRSAGHIRNAEMLKKGKPDMVLAFPGGVGTADMVEKARAAGVHVEEWE